MDQPDTTATARAILSLHTVDPHTGQTATTELTDLSTHGRCTVRLAGLPGSAGIHLPLVDAGGALAQRLEVATSAGEEVLLEMRLAEDGAVVANAGQWPVFTPSTDPNYSPLPPLVPVADGKKLDLALIIDGTARYYNAETARSQPLIPDRDLWARHTTLLCEAVDSLAGAHEDVQVAMFAFGDHHFTELQDKQLQPKYLLHPENPVDRALGRYSRERLERQLRDVPYSPGGDFLDALGDALHFATSSTLRWRPDARKLLLVSGDSPGYSVMHPAPWGADLLAREHDVDMVAKELHRRGVEVATIFHDLPEDSGYDSRTVKALLRHAEDQYRALACRRQWAFTLAGLDSETLSSRLATTGTVGRGHCLGQLLDVKPA